MGYGSYSIDNRTTRAMSMGYYSKSSSEIFKQKSINNGMNPNGVVMRESRDSDEHPQTVSIILALDVTGSMGSIPNYLVKDGLPMIMGKIIQKGIRDPQLLFLAIGDHECDESPLQVGQFEASDELLDKWLTDVYIESGGGGNGGESYLLAWYFAAHHTSIDCFEKRGQKGFLFTIGDEPVLKEVSARSLKGIMGDGQYENYTAVTLLDKAREKYNVYHLHIKQTASGSRRDVIDGWKQLMGDNLVEVSRSEDVSKVISDIVTKHTPVNAVDNNMDTVDKTETTIIL